MNSVKEVAKYLEDTVFKGEEAHLMLATSEISRRKVVINQVEGNNLMWFGHKGNVVEFYRINEITDIDVYKRNNKDLVNQ